MKPLLSEPELVLFTSFLGVADRYMEFGSGGSTCLAASLVKQSVVSVDTSRDWMGKVTAQCRANPDWRVPDMVHVDLGALGDWGLPTDPATRPLWPMYHQLPWHDPARARADVFMVDGRFRVACVMQILLRCQPHAVILIHDFTGREDYHVIRDVAREIASIDTLSVFQRRADQDEDKVRQILQRHEYQPR